MHAVVHLLLIILKINIKIRRDNGAYGDDVNGIIVIQSSTSIQNWVEVVGYQYLLWKGKRTTCTLVTYRQHVDGIREALYRLELGQNHAL